MAADPAQDLADAFGISRERTSEALAAALRGEVGSLRRFGVAIRPPWWRRRLQARLAPRRFRLWVQRETLRQIDLVAG
jgi:hypothetical protein